MPPAVSRSLLSFLLLSGVLWGGAAQAEPPAATLFNPKPAEGDLILPMPPVGETPVEMVFRAAQVPGSGLWGDSSRIVQVGDAGGGVFEGVQRTMVSGSFPTEDGKGWLIWLGKYELAKGQFAAVMGLDGLAQASGDPQDQKLGQLQGRALNEALATPLAWVGAASVQEFMQRYNRWLFDNAADAAARRERLPKLNGAPGFVRLAAEEEWEFAARGGMPAREQKLFDNRLPFGAAELNNYAWHLGNAKNKVRPIGLREPNPLGIHDLYGNVHEMTAGLFRPELTQGRPGGVPVRGASVSTPANEVRASLRTELDAWGWDAEKKQMGERRAFNIGARLAIGSNVVVDSPMRQALEQEYAAYRQGLRKETPAGRTLDNLVRQATVQLADVEPILAGLAERYPDDRERILSVQSYLDGARSRLDQAQRESARSLLQDALRNGVNLSVQVTKEGKLQSTLESARKLLEISTRYQAQVDGVEQSIRENLAAAAEQFGAYVEKIAALGEYDPDYIEKAGVALREKKLSPREAKVLELGKAHLTDFQLRRAVDREGWRGVFDQTFKSFTDQ